MSASELRVKLARRAADPSDIDPVLARLREHGYLNDAQFAESFATVRKESGGFGRQRVLRDLRQRRVAAPLAEKAVEQAFEGSDEIAAIEEWLRKKHRNMVLRDYLQDEKKLASTYRKLRYAGYSSGASIRVLRSYADRADELEDAEDMNEERT